MSAIAEHHQIDDVQKKQVLDFILHSTLSDFPESVIHDMRLAILDLLAVGAVGQTTQTAQIICEYACSALNSASGHPRSPLLFDGRMVSPAGAALAGGMMIDSIDAHDGYKPTKGHIGCALLPSVLSALMARDGRLDQEELLCSMIIGYEIGGRCGEALHATVSDYHTSGAWMAVAVAAIGARISGLDESKCWEALGIAEYHGPRSQMMRVIDHASMLKDGSGWGAFSGLSAVALADAGFTGAPAVTVGAGITAPFWSDLGTRWISSEQYFKPYPVCRWAQPALQAISDILEQTTLKTDDIHNINIETFHEALRLASPHPISPDEAQYSICWPVAAFLVAAEEGRYFGAYDVSEDALRREDIHQLADKIILSEDQALNAEFPRLRQCRVTISCVNGQTLQAFAEHTYGDPEAPVSYQDRLSKYDSFMSSSPHASAAEPLKRWCLDALNHADDGLFIEQLLFPAMHL